jgi:iron complex transport system ATP-binding protein
MKLEIKNALLGYHQKAILKHVGLELHTGQTICILGRNGAGKTTLFKSMLGILPLLEGEILLDGKNIGAWSRKRYARRVAYVPQARSLPFPFTVSDVVLFGRTAHLGLFASPGRKDRMVAGECMEKLHIAHLKDRIFTQLSGGEQQMVIIARALAQQPSFLIMDEPTTGLDFGNQVKIITQVNAMKDDSLGILMATHSPEQAFMCRADVAIIHEGEIQQYGTCDQVITEEILKNVYGVDVRIHAITDGRIDELRKVCLPVIA